MLLLKTCAAPPPTDEGDWFLRLAAYLLHLKRAAQGPWRLYIDLLPRVGGRQRG